MNTLAVTLITSLESLSSNQPLPPRPAPFPTQVLKRAGELSSVAAASAAAGGDGGGGASGAAEVLQPLELFYARPSSSAPALLQV